MESGKMHAFENLDTTVIEPLKNSMGESEEELRRRAAKLTPMGRILEPTEYNEALIFFMSDASAMTTGSVLNVTAGFFF